ncbi:UNVERIFIED_CONTAM: hypothetical protein HHA_461960 [Hammondia hammondi]|eukprot:XP_008883766.1 hypothetical protein HHA_461960 [Hammondia hammondi]
MRWISGNGGHARGNLASFASHPSSRLIHPPSFNVPRRLRVLTSPSLSFSPLSAPPSTSPYSFLSSSPSSPPPLWASSPTSISSFAASPLPPPQASNWGSAVSSRESSSSSPPSSLGASAARRAAGGRCRKEALGGPSETCAQSGFTRRTRERSELEAREDARVAGENTLSGREAVSKERGDEERANVGVDALGELHAEATAASSASFAQETILDQLLLATEELVWGRESGEKHSFDKERAEACGRRSLRGNDAERTPRLESEEESATAREVAMARGRGACLSKKTHEEAEREDAKSSTCDRSERGESRDANPREVSEKSSGPWWSDKLQCRLLSTISRLQKPRAILEIGTFTGLSTLSLAEGLSVNAQPSHPSPAKWRTSPRSEQQSGNEQKEEEEEKKEKHAQRLGAKDHLLPRSEKAGDGLEGRPPLLITIEKDRRALDVARTHFASSPYSAYIRVIEGDAREALALFQRKVKPRSVEGGRGPRLAESKRERKTLEEEKDGASENERQARLGERGEMTNEKVEDERARGEGDRQASVPETNPDARQADCTKAEYGQASFVVESDLRNFLIPPEGFDLIFLDASKRQYGEFLRNFILHPSQPLLAPEGLLLIDNILFKANRKTGAFSGVHAAREKEIEVGDATAETRKEGDSGDEGKTPTHGQKNADRRREQAKGKNEELSDPEHIKENRHRERLKEERVGEENKTTELEENETRGEREKKKEKRERRLEEIEREMKLVREMLRRDERVSQVGC